MRARNPLGFIALSALFAGCGGGNDLLLPGASEPATVTLVQGNDQNGRVGQPLPQPLVVTVTDASGRPVDGARIVFVLTAPAPGAAVTPDTTTTDANGGATAQVMLGTTPGTQTGEIRALGGNGTPTATATFTLHAVSENANGISAVSGDNQTAPVGSKLPSPLVVQVADAFGNPIAGVTVTWTAEGGGSVSSGTSTTDQTGQTSVERTLGSAAGTQRTLASVDGLAGSPVAFVHTATAGAASGVSIVSGNGQTGPVSTELPLPIVVEVRDAQGNVVSGVAVSWVIGIGGGSVTPATSNTDVSGRASAAWTLGGSPDSNTVSAVVSGIGVAEFGAKATAGAPARLSVLTQPSATAVSGVPLSRQPVIQLLDALGNPSNQSGVGVTAAIGSGAGTLGGTMARTTDGNGQATFTDLVITGTPGTRTLRFTANGFAAVTSTQIDVGAVPTVTTIVSDAPDPSVAGAQVTVQFAVTASSGTPTGSVTVTDGNNTCTGTLSGGNGSCALTLNTVGSRTLTATFAGGGGFGSSSDTEAHTVQAPPTPVLSIAQQPSPQATVGVPFAQQPVVQLKDGTGGVLATPGIAVSVAIASGGGTLAGTTTVSTDAQGRATFTDLAITGDPGSRTLTFTATGFTGVTSGAIDVQAAPPATTTTSITGTDPAGSAPAGSTVTVSFTVTAASGTPTGQVTVGSNLESTTCTAAVSVGSCALQLQTVGTHTLTATYVANGGFAGSSGTVSYEVTAGG
jgi:hypothetical protein